MTTNLAPRDGGHALRISIGIIILALLIAEGAGAATITVNASGGANYMRIQDAMNASSERDTIEVLDITYFDNVNVYKKLILSSVELVQKGEER